MTTTPDPLAARAVTLRSRLLRYTPTDPTDAESVQRETGWLEAIEELAAHLTHAGREKAKGMLDGTEEWVNGLTGSGVQP